ncbi:hypothetical protein JCM17380_48300 [Desulfosporosinus burensis]
MKFSRKWKWNQVTPLRITILYALTGGLWILFSDHLLGLIVSDHSVLLYLSTVKGWLYVTVTSVLLYALIQWGFTSLQKSEKVLKKDREHLERYQLLAEHVLDLIIFIRPDGQIIDANEAAVQRYGYTREELTNMPVHQLRLPEDQLSVATFLEKAPKGIQFELKHVCKDGSVFPIDISAKGATINGKPIIVSLIRDITKRKDVETEVWLAKERAQVTLESIGDAVITTDVRANVEYLNPVAEALTGWTNAEAVGLSLEQVFQIVNEDTGIKVESPIIRCLEEGKVVGLANHTVLINKAGSRIAIEDSAAPIRDRNETIIGAVLVFHDVSYKRNLIKELAHQAQHDALTGLPNRYLFNEHLKQALARAKRKQGKLAVMFLDLDRFKLINDTMGLNIKANQRLATENSLRKALVRGEFVLHYQPQVDFESGSIVGLEALIRWNSVERGMVSPVDFIPIAEETGLIVPIGEWVLRTACAQNKSWQEQNYPPLRIAVNISARQFREPDFIKLVAKILQETGLEPRWLELEITESIAMENGQTSLEMLNSFKELGVRISIDDFGTGFSSLNYLRRMPIDTLKIDQCFIQDISSGENGEEVVTAIIQLAKNLNLKVIAEGVETNTQRSFLKDKLCDEMQGYLYSKAVTSQDVEKLFVQPPK